ncbi:MAG: GntR family transcriptional regulator [Lentisphaeria bacterium]|nr:GntR family transcriptional regulator [Lentisphaeria bacterium]
MRKTLQIRHYLIGEIYRAGTSSVKLPSVRELAKQFTVAQCTVSAVTADLIRDGWLRSRRGLGLFTNPEKIADESVAGLIGVLNGDGCLYYFNQEVFDAFVATGREILKRHYNFRNIMLDSADADEMVRVVQQQPICGLIWNAGTVIVPEEPAIRLARSGLPLVADCPHFEKVNVVCSEFSSLGIAWSDYLTARSDSRVLFYLPEWHSRQLIQWIGRKIVQVQPGQEIPNKAFQIVVTDAPHRMQIQKVYPSAEVHEWNILPNGKKYIPDYKRLAEATMHRLLHIKKEDKYVEQMFVPLKEI